MGKQSPQYRVAGLGAPEFIAGAVLTGLVAGLLASTVLALAVAVTGSPFGLLSGLLVRLQSVDAAPQVEY